MRKSAHPRGQFAQFFFHLGGIKVGVSTFFTLGVDLKKFFTLGCTPPHPHPVPIYDDLTEIPSLFAMKYCTLIDGHGVGVWGGAPRGKKLFEVDTQGEKGRHPHPVPIYDVGMCIDSCCIKQSISMSFIICLNFFYFSYNL